MGRITPRSPQLLIDTDVNYAPFHCCGDEDLVFIKCPACHHLMVFCYECETLYPDLAAPTPAYWGQYSVDDRRHIICPRCRQPFEDFAFLMQPYVDKYLVTAKEVMDRGFRHLLSDAISEHLE